MDRSHCQPHIGTTGNWLVDERFCWNRPVWQQVLFHCRIVHPVRQEKMVKLEVLGIGIYMEEHVPFGRVFEGLQKQNALLDVVLVVPDWQLRAFCPNCYPWLHGVLVPSAPSHFIGNKVGPREKGGAHDHFTMKCASSTSHGAL